MTARDLAKLGSLVLHHGKWHDEQIISAQWIELSTTRWREDLDPWSADGAYGYGLQWWHGNFASDGDSFEAFTALGYGAGGPFRCGQLWRYRPDNETGRSQSPSQDGRLELFLESADPTMLDGADNLTVSPWGDLVLCEDGFQDQFLVGVTPRGDLYKLARNALSNSEFAGATFSPDGTTLFVNIQDDGISLAINGPWGTAA